LYTADPTLQPESLESDGIYFECMMIPCVCPVELSDLNFAFAKRQEHITIVCKGSCTTCDFLPIDESVVALVACILVHYVAFSLSCQFRNGFHNDETLVEI